MESGRHTSPARYLKSNGMPQVSKPPQRMASVQDLCISHYVGPLVAEIMLIRRQTDWNLERNPALLNVMRRPEPAPNTGGIMNKFASIRTVTLISLFVISLMTTACNTIAGAGKDTSAAGNAVTDTAEKSK